MSLDLMRISCAIVWWVYHLKVSQKKFILTKESFMSSHYDREHLTLVLDILTKALLRLKMREKYRISLIFPHIPHTRNIELRPCQVFYVNIKWIIDKVSKIFLCSRCRSNFIFYFHEKVTINFREIEKVFYVKFMSS